MATQRRVTLDWSRTWDDRPNDYVAKDGAAKVGRVHALDSTSAGGWFWTMYGSIGNRVGSQSGIAETCDEACYRAEREWLVFKDRMAELGVKPSKTRPRRAPNASGGPWAPCWRLPASTRPRLSAVVYSVA